MVINFFWILLLTVFSIITDLFIFCNISNTYKRNKITIWVIGLIAILLAIFSPTQLFMNFGVTILEIMMLSLYFICIKKQNIKLILGSCLIFGITDLSILTLEAFFKIIVPIENGILNYIFDLIVNIVIICVTKKYNVDIKNRLLDKNRNCQIFCVNSSFSQIDLLIYEFFPDSSFNPIINISNSIIAKLTLQYHNDRTNIH